MRIHPDCRLQAVASGWTAHRPSSPLLGLEASRQGQLTSTSLPLVLRPPLPGTQPGSRGLPRPAARLLPLVIHLAAVLKACLPLQPQGD